MSPTELVAELQSSEGALTVPDPALEVRAGDRRAISSAITDGLAPDGYMLRHKGRTAVIWSSVCYLAMRPLLCESSSL